MTEIKYQSTILSVAVHRPADSPIFGECVTTVRVEDEAGGAFIAIRQNERPGVAEGEIWLDSEELELKVRGFSGEKAMSQQPEALRLAKALKVYNAGVYSQALAEEYDKASAMLRNQHAEIERLRAELEDSEQKIRIWRATFLHAETERGAYKMECERLRAELAESATDLSRVLETVKYLAGIAERGEGRKIEESEPVEQFVLGYVKKLEAEIERLRAELEAVREQEPIATLGFGRDEWRAFLDALRPYPDGTKFYLAAGAQPAPLQEMLDWPKGATHYQPQQKAFYKRVSACEWYVWSRITDEPLHWSYSPGTIDSAEWIVREQPAPSLCDRPCSEFQNAECPGDPGRPCCMEAQPAPSVPEGWKLAPIEPPGQMKERGKNAAWSAAVAHNETRSIYKSMLDAAPEAPKRKPLTVDELDALRQADNGQLNFATLRAFRVIARAVEAAHGIKE